MRYEHINISTNKLYLRGRIHNCMETLDFCVTTYNKSYVIKQYLMNFIVSKYIKIGFDMADFDVALGHS